MTVNSQGNWLRRPIDAFMIRYNAAHRGAEKDIFPYLDKHNPAVISYTATRWRFLLKKPKTWKQERIPTAGMCYRFVLSNLQSRMLDRSGT